MPKMKLGKTAENGKLSVTPNCRNWFGSLGQNAENFTEEILGPFLNKECWKQ
jgi:hypothetical protein